ncbi:FAD:protein FMN transferase [Fuchsiella alkaliacetigena]|uniref:FAD:protein FMN transferase n=1 Tax=Fuchsiella alkaliacetigena TaxID=957042 RepID=UPI00200ACC33|nr:FAD:protein FMN transferase [Fuchsiella alkaliacetigena]MCK8824454.1 FAD:protein FMN transferase [Fuchsiella alkaliacetigena]
MKNKKIPVVLATLFVLAVLAVGFWRTSSPSVEDHEVQEFLMDTVVNIRVSGEDAEEAVEASLRRMRELADKIDINRDDNQLNEINRQAGQKAVEVDEEVLFIIQNAKEYGELSQGGFDVTIAPVLNLWGFGSGTPGVPSEEEITERLELVNYEDIIIDEEASTVMLAREGMRLDLGGASKGYIIEQGIETLKEYGIESALIGAGDIRALGTRPDGEEWTVAIRNPRPESDKFADNEFGGQYVTAVRGADFSMATSGDYERYFEEDGEMYHHILDAKTGYPVRGLASVTVITDTTLMEVDLLSTALFIMGFEEAKEYIESKEHLEGMIITEELEIWQSQGFEKLKAE